MKRYPIFDPPEYLNWVVDPNVIEEYRETLERDPVRSKIVAGLTPPQLLNMYAAMLRFRLHDITLHRWVRQGILSKAWLGTGEEAVTIGNVHALDRRSDLVAPMIRNAGACHEMGMSVADMLRGYLATADSPTRGKDLHLGDLKQGIIAPVSQVGALSPVVAGVALAFRQRQEKRVVLTWVGDGATKTSAFHEGVNLAAVLHIPVIYVLQNNQVALGTRLEHHQSGPFHAWNKAYGVAGYVCDGNNVLDTFAATKQAVDQCRAGFGPAIIFAETFRMGGHATHDEREARAILPAPLFDYWGKRDPIGMYEAWLAKRGITQSLMETTEQEVIDEIAMAEKEALASGENRMPKPRELLEGVYARCESSR
jgi:TPP-dependent pyruvate/acetoin dehydrogenase alpha subunit